MRARVALVAWPLSLFTVGLALSYGAAVLDHDAEAERTRESVRAALEPIRGALSRELVAAFELTEGLSALTAVQGGISSDTFRAFAAELVRRNDLVRHVALAPDNVVEYVYPLDAANARAVGLDYAKNAAQWPSIARMLREQKMIVAGPVSLVQGGVAVIARSPIYVADPAGTDQPGRRYWGLTSTVVDFERLLARTPLGADPELVMALRGVDSIGAQGAPFWGDAAVFDDAPVLVDVPLPAGSWQLAAAPRGGWSPGPVWTSEYFWAGSALFLVLAALLLKVLEARRARDVEVLHRLESERKLRAIFEEAPLGIAVIESATGRALELNPRYASIAGYSEETLRTRTLEDVSNPENQVIAREVMASLRAGLPIQREAAHRREDGSTAWVSLTCVPLSKPAEAGAAQHLAMVADISKSKHAEELAVASERLAALGMLAAGVAHEINNPLAALMANIELAQQELARPSAASATELHARLADARECAERVRSIVSDLKVFSRADDEGLRAVDVASVLDSTQRMVSNELRHRARLVRADGESIPRVRANESKLGQVFTNLLVNAAEAIPAGRADDNEVRVTTRLTDDGLVAVAFSDTGSGMSAEVLARMFSPFFTTKSNGTGLGLAICERIIADLGGRFEVASEVGVGTTITVFLVAAEAISEPVATPEPSAPMATTRARILVVDDEEMLAKAIHRMLRSEHDVKSLTSAREAIELVLAGQRYDIILSDLMMPEVTGMDLHAAIAEVSPEQADRIVFMTGGAFSVRAREFLETVNHARIEKPFDSQRLRALIDRRLAAQR